MRGISSVASRNNPIKYTDPDGNAFCVVTAIIGAAVGGGLAAYDSYKRNNGKIKLGGVALGAAFGGAIGLGIGLIGAQVATSTALQAGNCLAGFSEVTGWGMAATGEAGAATAGGAAAAQNVKAIKDTYDIVYEPSSGGSLRALADKVGAKLLTDFDMFKSGFSNWKDFSISKLNEFVNTGKTILFDLTNMKDIPNILKGVGEFSETVTA